MIFLNVTLANFCLSIATLSYLTWTIRKYRNVALPNLQNGIKKGTYIVVTG